MTSNNYEPLPRDLVFALDDATTKRSREHSADRELRDTIQRLYRRLAQFSMPTEGDVVAGARLVVEVGQGAFGIVWKAYDEERQSDVAVKVFRYERLAVELALHQFRRGARIMKRLSESSEAPATVLRMLRTDEAETAFAMEYLPRLDLTRNVARLTVKERLGFFSQICEAVSFAHSKGVVHRDIRPHNILVRDNDTPVLADFDIADFAFTTKNTRLAIGTLLYAAPEQLAGDNDPRNFAVDIFSLGRVLQFLLLGKDPPATTTTLSGFSEFDEILSQSLAIEPSKRPQTVEHLVSLLPLHVSATVETVPLLFADSIKKLETAKSVWRDAARLASNKMFRAAIKKGEAAIGLVQDDDYSLWDDWKSELDRWKVLVGDRTWAAHTQELFHRVVPGKTGLLIAGLLLIVAVTVPVLKVVVSAHGPSTTNEAPPSTSLSGVATVKISSPPATAASASPTPDAPKLLKTPVVTANPAFSNLTNASSHARGEEWLARGVGRMGQQEPVLPLREHKLALDVDEVQLGTFVCRVRFDGRGDPSELRGCTGRGVARTSDPVNLVVRCLVTNDRSWVNCGTSEFQYAADGERRSASFRLSLRLEQRKNRAPN